MKLYDFASESTIGCMLAQKDDDGIKNAIYYLSRVLNDTKTRYSSIENCVYVSISHILNQSII